MVMMSSRSSNQLQLHEFTLVVPLQLIIYHIRCAFFLSEKSSFQHLCAGFVPQAGCVCHWATDLVRGRKQKISLMSAEKHIFCPSHF